MAAVHLSKLAANATNLAATMNPYYPIGSEIPGYVANKSSVLELLGIFFSACIILFTATYFVAKRVQPNLNGNELITIMWFVLSGTIHIFFEGYYAANFQTLGSKQTLIGQMWKEYAFSDSRYLTQDALVLCVESVTAMFWGPGCLLMAALIILRNPFRYPVQMIVSMGQFYGDILYYATSLFELYVAGKSYSRPEPFYFWFYFVLMNAFWIVIPGGKFRASIRLHTAADIGM
jgi:cholestenol delta-isomerase